MTGGADDKIRSKHLEAAIPDKFRKHVALTHSYADLSLTQRKLINILIPIAIHEGVFYVDDRGVEWYGARIQHILDTLGTKTKNRSWIKQELKGLQGLQWEFDLLDDGASMADGEPAFLEGVGEASKASTPTKPECGHADQETGRSPRNPDMDDDVANQAPNLLALQNRRATWQSDVVIPSVAIGEDGHVFFTINPTIRDEVLDPVRWSVIDVKEQAALRKPAGHCLYELLSRFSKVQSTGFRTEKEWRLLLGVGEKYKGWSRFRDMVLRPAIQDVEQNTRFRIREFETRRQRSGSREWEARCRFEREIQRAQGANSSTPQADAGALTPAEKDAIGAMRRHGVSEREALTMLETAGVLVVQQALEEIKPHLRRGDIAKPGRWLGSRIRTLHGRGKKLHEDSPGTTTQSGRGSREDAGQEIDTSDPEVREQLWKVFLRTLSPVEEPWASPTHEHHSLLIDRYEEFVEEHRQRAHRGRKR